MPFHQSPDPNPFAAKRYDPNCIRCRYARPDTKSDHRDHILFDIAEILRSPEWYVSMLEDLAELVRNAGYDLDIPPATEYYSH